MKKSYIIFLTVALAIIIGCVVYSSYVNKKIDESINAPATGDVLGNDNGDSGNLAGGTVLAGSDESQGNWNDTPDANILPMKLTDKPWTWVSTNYTNGTKVLNKSPEKFIATFTNNTFSISTDCNGIGGEYNNNKGNNISFSRGMSTLMYCEGSQESEFSKALNEVESYSFSGHGELILNLKNKQGTMIFQ